MSSLELDPLAATRLPITATPPATATLSTARVSATLEIAAVEQPPAVAVTLGQVSTPDRTYSNLGQSNATSMAWAQPAAGSASRLMEDNLGTSMKSGRLGSLLNGLGSELLSGLGGGKREWQQSVAVYRPGYREPGSATNGTTAVDALRAAGEVDNAITVKIRTRSGQAVEIGIRFGGDGKAVQGSLGIELKISGELSAAEQEAIGKLAQGLDAALQGATSVVPRVDLAGLVAFDSTLIEGVDVDLRTATQRNGLQSFEFRADATSRSFSLQTTGGRVAVDVDLSAAPLGSADQQRAAVQRFLEQFDAANVRAHGEEVLLEQFKTAFAQLNADYPPLENRPAPALPEWILTEQDRSVLTGLADFAASMSGEFDNGSPSQRITEAGHLRYDIAQRTTIEGVAKDSGLAIAQTVTTALRATQERSRNGLALDKEGGSYDVFGIEDRTSTTTSIEYADFDVVSATLDETASQRDRYEKWVAHELVEQRVTPRDTRVLRDLVEELRPRS